jgi:hypothetical protein
MSKAISDQQWKKKKEDMVFLLLYVNVERI